MASLTFPSNTKNLSQRPFIRFSCSGKDAKSIILPIPGSLQFGDGATYNNTELGFLGGSLSAISSTVSAGGNVGDVTKQLGEIGKNATAGKGIGAIIQGVTSMTGAPEGIQSAISIGTGTTLNKNINSEFTATNTRVFSFAFQLIPMTTDEAKSIQSIVDAFRINLYPEGDDFQLYYPPKWAIEFRRGGTGQVIADIPRIGDVYLTEVSTTFNGTSNMWRTDGSPIETSIQLQFMETKAYRRDNLPK